MFASSEVQSKRDLLMMLGQPLGAVVLAALVKLT